MKLHNIFLTLLQRARPRITRRASVLRHVGALGLFFIAILDSTPIPTFGGPDILTAVLSSRRGEPWYYYAAAATLGSVIGAYLTFHIARRAGSTYLSSKFGARRVATVLEFFERWGTGALVLSAFLPIPSPTSTFFAAAGVLDYPVRKFLVVVGLARAARYFAIAALASYFGRRAIQVFIHPRQYLGWLLLIVCFVAILIAAAVVVRRQFEAVREDATTQL